MRGVVAGFGIISAIAAIAMLQFTTPQSVGPFGVLAFFILIYIMFASVIFLSIGAVINLSRRVLGAGKLLLAVEGMSSTRQYYYSSFLALIPVILIGINSVGSIGILEITLLVLFGLLGCFYISRRF